MARSFHILAGWWCRNEDAYGGASGGQSVGLGFAHCFLGGDTLSPIFHNGTEKTIRSVLINQFSTEEWSGMNVGDYTTLMETNTTVSGVLNVQVEKTAGGYMFRLERTGISGWIEDGTVTNHTFGLANRHDLRLITDGANWTLDVDGVLEVSHAETGKIALGPTGEIILRGLPSGADDATKRNQYKGVVYYSYDTIADQLGADFANTMMFPDGNGHHTQFSGAFGDVDDWKNNTHDSAATEDTSINVSTGGPTTARQSYDVTDPGMSNDLGCLLVYAEVRVTNGAKSAETGVFVDDGSHAYGPTITNLVTAYVAPSPQRAIFETKPSGGAWTDASLDNLEIGVRVIAGAAAVEAMSLTAIQAEFFDFNEDPRAAEAPTGRRRAIPQEI